MAQVKAAVAAEKFRECFGTPQGEFVLKYLIRKTHFVSSTFVAGDSHHTAYNEGQRSIVISILRQANKSEEWFKQAMQDTIYETHSTRQFDPDPNAPPGGGGGAPPPGIPENWRDFIDEPFRKDPTLAQVKDVNTLAKNYVEAQKFIGKNRMEAPDKSWKPEQWSDFWNKAGRPEAPDKYDLNGVKVPDGFDLDKEGVEAMRKIAHESGLNNQQVAKMFGWYLDYENGRIGKSLESQKAKQNEADAALKQEWGGKYDENLDIARTALKKFADPEFVQHLEASGLGNDPRMIKVMHKIGRQIVEDSAGGRGPGLQVQDATAAKLQISQIQMDEKFMAALTTAHHPGHKAAVQKWTELHAQAHPGKVDAS